MELMDSRSMRPEEIEAESFRIIEKEAGEHDWPDDQWPIVRRAIHTTADYEYLQSLVITPDAIPSAISALRAGRAIITDTNMALAGIRKDLASRLGCSLDCPVADTAIAEEARASGITRSMAASRCACRENLNGIIVIGKAPTALVALL